MKILNSFKSDEIEYGPVVKNLNWFKHPAKPVPPQVVRVSKTKDRLLRFRENLQFCLDSDTNVQILLYPFSQISMTWTEINHLCPSTTGTSCIS